MGPDGGTGGIGASIWRDRCQLVQTADIDATFEEVAMSSRSEGAVGRGKDHRACRHHAVEVDARI